MPKYVLIILQYLSPVISFFTGDWGTVI